MASLPNEYSHFFSFDLTSRLIAKTGAPIFWCNLSWPQKTLVAVQNSQIRLGHIDRRARANGTLQDHERTEEIGVRNFGGSVP